MTQSSDAFLNIQMHGESKALEAEMADINYRLFHAKGGQISKLYAEKAKIQMQIDECAVQRKEITRRLNNMIIRPYGFLPTVFARLFRCR